METIQRCEEASKVTEEAREKHRGRRVSREGEVGPLVQGLANRNVRAAVLSHCHPGQISDRALQSSPTHLERCIWMFCLHVCLCTTYVTSAHQGQKRVSGPLKLEFQMVVSCPTGVQAHLLIPLTFSFVAPSLSLSLSSKSWY